MLDGIEVFEVKIDDEFLMSSLYTVGEVALSDLSLGWIQGCDLSVVVGGLGLGYTAAAALADKRVDSLVVIEALGEVIEWHRQHLVPLGEELTRDPRCTLQVGDFFKLLASGDGDLDPIRPGHRFDVVLVDIDHSPTRLLHPSHGILYEPGGLQRIARQLAPGGVFALWSDDRPDDGFCGVMSGVFDRVEAQIVEVPLPHTERKGTNTIYLGQLLAEAKTERSATR